MRLGLSLPLSYPVLSQPAVCDSFFFFFDSRSEGNLVNELDNRNPTALLVSAIAKSTFVDKVGKDDAFYLGVLRDGELWQIHRIMSGGPSRGTMALESETAPREGSSVQVSRPFTH